MGNFCQNTRHRHPIARLQGQRMECFLWVQSMIYVLPVKLPCCGQYHIDGVVQDCSNSIASNSIALAMEFLQSCAKPLMLYYERALTTSNCIIQCNLNRMIISQCPMFGKYHFVQGLTHWGRVTHICVGKLTIIGSDNGLSPDRRQAIIWTNAGLLLIGPLATNFSEILIEILTFSFKKMRLKVSSAKRWPFCLGLNVLMI